jgi:hypothetical protein
MKKLWFVCILVALVFGMSSTTVAADGPSAWAVAEVNAANKLGIVPVNSQQNYAEPISRINTVEMLILMIEKYTGKSIEEFLDEKDVAISPDVFADTTDRNILAAYALGIVKGMDESKFGPNGTLTRAQMAAMANRNAEVHGITTAGFTHKFTDVQGHWVDLELGWPSTMGIINGVGNSKFDPDGKLTCEQAIVITYRLWQVLHGETPTPPPVPPTPPPTEPTAADECGFMGIETYNNVLRPFAELHGFTCSISAEEHPNGPEYKSYTMRFFQNGYEVRARTTFPSLSGYVDGSYYMVAGGTNAEMSSVYWSAKNYRRTTGEVKAELLYWSEMAKK